MEGMELQKHPPAMFENLGEDVGSRQAGDIPRPEHHRHAAGARTLLHLAAPGLLEIGEAAGIVTADGGLEALVDQRVVERAERAKSGEEIEADKRRRCPPCRAPAGMEDARRRGGLLPRALDDRAGA